MLRGKLFVVGEPRVDEIIVLIFIAVVERRQEHIVLSVRAEPAANRVVSQSGRAARQCPIACSLADTMRCMAPMTFRIIMLAMVVFA